MSRIRIILAALLVTAAGCEAVNVSRDPFAVPVTESVYDLSPPAIQSAEDPIDPDAPFAALRIWLRENSR